MTTNRLLGLLIAIFTLSFAITSALWLDPDFGWHYRMGQIIMASGFPQTDPFSFTMPSYPFVDYEWLSNVLYFSVYDHLGYFPLSLLHSLLATVAPVIVLVPFVKKGKNSLLLLPIFLTWSVFVQKIGVRPQVFSWFFMSIFVFIFYQKDKWIAYRWAFPPLMMLWVNFHGSYPIPILLATIIIFYKSLIAKKVVYLDFVVLALGILATFINPYGVRNWHEVLNQMALTGLYRQTVVEWKSALFTFDMGFFFLYILTFFIGYINRKKIEVWELIIFAGGLFAGLSSTRHAPLSALLISPILMKYILLFEGKAKSIEYGPQRLQKFARVLLAISIIIFISQSVFSYRTLSKLTETDFYPQGVSDHLNQYPESKRVFANYSIGGYLIWKAPLHKYYIDGRMPGFVWTRAPQGESNNAFVEYLDIMCGDTPLEDGLNKYNADLVVAQKTNPQDVSQVAGTIQKRITDIFYRLNLIYCKGAIDVEKELDSSNWGKAYEDDGSIVFIKHER